MSTQPARGLPLSIQIKVILPYLLLTLSVAMLGIYVVTRLVANSLNERLTNQLLEAGRVVSDSLARQDVKHLEVARLVGYTSGLAEALADADRQYVTELTEPVAAGLSVENLVLVDAAGDETLHLLRQADGKLAALDQPSGAAGLAIVQALLEEQNPGGLPRRTLGLNPIDRRYYYYTAIPVGLNGRLAGIVLVGTSLNTLVPYWKATSLADLIIYADNGRVIATSLAAEEEQEQATAALVLPVSRYQTILKSPETVSGESFQFNRRWYSLARGPLRVADETLGAFAVVLPLNFVLQAGTTSRTTYVGLFALAMLAVVLVGYIIARRITVPLNVLVRTSQAIAAGDLTQRTGVRSRDELGVLANSFDKMTENLQQRTTELQEAYRVLEQMDRTKTSFIDVSAHELRTPLTLILGYAQMLKEQTNGDPDMIAMLRGIEGGANRMLEVVNSMLDVSKIDNQTLKVIPQPISIGDMVSDLKTELQPALEERHQTLVLAGLIGLPMVNLDPDLMRKVFQHLVTNAMKYTPDGGTVTVDGRLVQEELNKPELELTVSDTGIGIDPQHQQLIFEKFYQTGEVLLHSSGKTRFKGGGPGLGLAVTRGIVLAHGGRIWVVSPGCDEKKCPGSQFYIRLPYVEAKEE